MAKWRVDKKVGAEHGGTLTVTSVEGQGSTFTLRLPLAAPDDAQLPES